MTRTDLRKINRPSCLGLAAVLLAALWLAPLASAQRVEKRFPTSANPTVSLRTENGQVKITGWGRTEVRLVVVPGPAVRVIAEERPNRVEIGTQVLREGSSPNERSINYEIMAPEESSLVVHCYAGSVQIERIRGDISVDTVTAGIVLREIQGHTAVRTMSAPVSAERSSGRLEANSVSGDLRFFESSAPSLTANTTSGLIYFDGILRNGGAYNFTNYSGAIELLLSAQDSFELKANSVKGVVESEIPLVQPRAQRATYAPRLSQTFTGLSRAGDASVQASSFSGKITIRKR